MTLTYNLQTYKKVTLLLYRKGYRLNKKANVTGCVERMAITACPQYGGNLLVFKHIDDYTRERHWICADRVIEDDLFACPSGIPHGFSFYSENHSIKYGVTLRGPSKLLKE